MSVKETDTEKIYGEDSIDENEGPTGVRKRPATLIGNDDIRGCMHTVFELVANGADECREGYGEAVDVTIREDNSVIVRDYGRGVPMALNPKNGRYNWELVFCTLYASGKGAGSVYSSSEGLNGIGCTVTQYTSDYMIVTSVRDSESDGKRYKYVKNFEKGYPVGELMVEEVSLDELTGTSIEYLPSSEVFTDIDIPFDMIAERMRLKAVVLPGVKLRLTYKDKETVTYDYPSGLGEFLEESLESNVSGIIALHGENVRCNDTKEKVEARNYTGNVDMAISFSFDGAICQMFHNGAILTGGPSKNAVYDAIAKLLTDEGYKAGKLKDKEKLTVRDVELLLSVVCETRCPPDFSKYENQTKTEINNPSLCKLITQTIKEELGVWFLQHSEIFDVVLNAALINKTTRESADRLRSSSIKKITSNINRVGNAPRKFLNCESTKADECEVYVMEGESAKGAIVGSRDSRIQAAMPLRGKIPNCLKKGLEVLVSEDGKEDNIIVQLLTVLGCGIELTTKEMKRIKDIPAFDITKLNFHKIIISTDADVDGGHIMCLLLVFMWRFCPQLLKNGNVYYVYAPLFKVSYGAKREKLEYFYTEEEKNKFVEKLQSKGSTGFDVSRFKGLGEMQPEDMESTLMNTRTRRLTQIEYPEDEQELSRVCFGLMGDDISLRKAWIDDYFNSEEVIIGE